MIRRALPFALLLSFVLPLAAQEPIRYTLRFPAPHTHYVEVSATVPATGPATELFMAVWTPGSYMVREYSRHVEDFKATASGRPLAWHKSKKNRWSVQSEGAATFDISYRVYAREASVQGNWVEAGFAMLNGAANFMTLAGREHAPHEVRLELPYAWSRSISGMAPLPGAASGWRAADFDELLDSPIYAGNAPIHEFEAGGKKHYLVNEGEGPMWDGPASAADVKRVVDAFSRMWGGLPYTRYVFFNMLVESGGGLEHRNSTWMNTSRWAYGNSEDDSPGGADPSQGARRRPSRLGWLGLVSHEYFHTWNVKRLRPVELGPFDFENEVYTPSLWIAEGLTSYYGPIALARAGLSNQAQFLRSMSGAIAQLQSTPGRLVLPLESASFDAWIKLYRPNENSRNTAISYYTKGQVVGFLLDAKIRKLTSGSKTLDDVMRLAYARHSGAKGFTAQQYRAAASEVAGTDLGAWFKQVLETTAELDYSEALSWYGLRFRKPGPQRPVRTGISVSAASGRIVVTGVERETPGYESGVNVDDEILAVNGYRVRAESWPSRLDSYRKEKTVELLIARRDRLMTLTLPIVAAEQPSWTLETDPAATEDQKARLKAWLGQ